MIELVHPSAHSSPQSKPQMDRFSRFFHSLRQKVPILYNGRPYPRELPFPMEDLDLPCNTWCFRPIPLPSNRHHRCNGDCMEGKGENYEVCSVQYCVQQLCTVQCGHIWTDLTVLWIGFCLTGPISLCLDSFLYGVLLVLYACVDLWHGEVDLVRLKPVLRTTTSFSAFLCWLNHLTRQNRPRNDL